ncbi:hypothetical protein SPONN_2063 [uncultured Candidatus Thioglobus sp.]|nr:hypothetical protein SPONN_2063 [uncultured Candidatus Thioglobus sp.]
MQKKKQHPNQHRPFIHYKLFKNSKYQQTIDNMHPHIAEV